MHVLCIAAGCGLLGLKGSDMLVFGIHSIQIPTYPRLFPSIHQEHLENLISKFNLLSFYVLE
jgi:hypothetical protein